MRRSDCCGIRKKYGHEFGHADAKHEPKPSVPFRAPPLRRTAFLPGKVVWITGASSGLGEQLAISAAAKGAAALILSGRREDALERVKRACEEASMIEIEGRGARRDDAVGLRVEVLPFDVADLDFVEKEAAGRAIQLFGRVDALVLNAGVRYVAVTLVCDVFFVSSARRCVAGLALIICVVFLHALVSRFVVVECRDFRTWLLLAAALTTQSFQPPLHAWQTASRHPYLDLRSLLLQPAFFAGLVELHCSCSTKVDS